MRPAISVLMPVHNGAVWLAQAVASVQAQTETAWELIVVDDASTDGTPYRLKSIEDPRLRVLTMTSRRGVTRALNHGLMECRAPYIARLDADDLMRRDRLAVQRAYLDTHPNVGVLGTWSLIRTGEFVVTRDEPPTDAAAIRRALRRMNPIAHPTVLMRRHLVERVGGYDERYPVAQDYKLWTDMARITDLENYPQALTLRRRHAASVSATRTWARRWAQARIRGLAYLGACDPSTRLTLTPSVA